MTRISKFFQPTVMAVIVVLIAQVFVVMTARGAEFPVPAPGNDIVGDVLVVSAREGETLLDIARAHDLGYNEIVAANPDVDPWLPDTGAAITIPTRYVLPNAPRSGIVINIAEMRLYYYPPPTGSLHDIVMTFPIGIGQEGWATPEGEARIIVKKENPVWTVPKSIREASAAQGEPLPKVVLPGPDNPLGKYALRLDMVGYLIHGTNKPFGIGRRISHGCIRMYPEDIEVLFRRVELGTQVSIINQPYKLGKENGALYLESHEPVFETGEPARSNLPEIIHALSAMTESARREQIKEKAMTDASRHEGIPHYINEVRIELEDESGEGWMLQVGAFANADNAMRIADAMNWLEMPVSIKVRLDDGYCHVLIGPFPGEEQANDVLRRVFRQDGIKGLIYPAGRHGMLTSCVS